MSAQKVAAGDYADEHSRIVSANHWKSSDSFQHHVVGCVAERVVLEDDRRLSANYFAEQLVAGPRVVDEIAPRNHADQESLGVKHRKTLMGRGTAALTSSFG
jgi:hypothetical protein